MSETPNNPDQPNGSEQPGTPPAEQPGYWESQAAPAAPVPPSPGIQFNPQSAYPADGTPPPYPGAPQQPGYPTYGQSGYGQPGYPQPTYSPPAYGQPGYPPPYGYPGYPTYAKPEHPQANTALVVGIIGLAGGLMLCGVPLLASPFAWVIGQRAKNEIDREPGRWGGRDRANTGMVLGIIGTGLLALALVAVVALVLIVAASDPYTY